MENRREEFMKKISKMATIYSLALVSLVRKVKAASASVQARGWGDHIEWVGIQDGQRQSADQKKPLMLVVHKMTCPVCLSLKRHFSTSSRVANLSRSLVMVNLAVHEVPYDDQFMPDGNYVPRIMFYRPGGQLMRELRHTPDGEYMYNYPNVDSVVEAMESAIGKSGGGGGGANGA